MHDAVLLYLKNGGRAVHGAWMYCNQEAIGRAVADSGVPREEVFLMSMLPQWCELGCPLARILISALPDIMH